VIAIACRPVSPSLHGHSTAQSLLPPHSSILRKQHSIEHLLTCLYLAISHAISLFLNVYLLRMYLYPDIENPPADIAILARTCRRVTWAVRAARGRCQYRGLLSTAVTTAHAWVGPAFLICAAANKRVRWISTELFVATGTRKRAAAPRRAS